MVAEVIINRLAKDLNRIFDYIVPTEMEENIKVGARVFVPFGSKNSATEAFVIGLKESSEFANKEIVRIEDFALTKENVELAKLMSRRYFCNISDCLKLMLPPGTAGKVLENRAKDKTGEFVYLKKDVDDILSDIETGIIKTPKQVRSLQFLIENEGIHILDLEILTDTSRSIIKTLDKNGYIPHFPFFFYI